jgi:MFS family permease
MANVSGAVQIETGIKHGLSIPFQSVAGEQSIDVGTLLIINMKASLIVAAILGFVGFVTSFGAHVVVVNLPTYAKEVGIGLAYIGVLIAVYDFAEIIPKPIFGALGDHVGMKKTMLAGIVLFTIASILYPFINPQLLIVVRFLQGVGAAALSAVSLALIGVYFKENRGKAYGIYNAIKGAGYVVSPVIGGAIVTQKDFSGIFYATAGVGVVAFLISVFLPDPRTQGKISLDDDGDFSLKKIL